MRRKANKFEQLIIALLNGVFLQTAGSWGAFIIDDEGNFIDDWNCEDENIGTGDLTDGATRVYGDT